MRRVKNAARRTSRTPSARRSILPDDDWLAKLRALVVGRDGLGYEMESWRESRAYRSGEQENLLVPDKRTRDYEFTDRQTKRDLYEGSWCGRHLRLEGGPPSRADGGG